MTRLVVIVHGRPAPQGSKRHVGGGRMIEQSKYVGPWREAVKTATLQALQRTPDYPRHAAAYRFIATFTIARPRSHYRTGKNAHLLKLTAPMWPATKPDLDKLDRATLDALTDAGAIPDDARIVSINAVKTYPAAAFDALDNPGAVITLTPLEDWP